MLQWARANGCDWNSDTCLVAAAGGHLEVLQWARANGCDWLSRDACLEAAPAGGGNAGVAPYAASLTKAAAVMHGRA